MKRPKDRIEIVDSGEETYINWRGKVKAWTDRSRFCARIFLGDELAAYSWGATEAEAIERATRRSLEIRVQRENEANPKVIAL